MCSSAAAIPHPFLDLSLPLSVFTLIFPSLLIVNMSIASSSQYTPFPYPSPPPTSTLLFTPPPFNSSSKEDRLPRCSSQHLPLQSQNRKAHGEAGVEEVLSCKKAENLARAKLRKLPCPWRGVRCDAILASVDILQKHIEMHICRTKLEDSDSDSDSKDDLDILDPRVRCHWDRCISTYPDLGGLVRHNESLHISTLALASDFTGAIGADTPDPYRPTLEPSPPLPDIPVPPYLITAPSVPSELSLPKPQTLMVASSSSRPGLRTRPPSEASASKPTIHPIMPIRDPDDYWPMHGEADIQLSHYWPSSSFFPRVVPIQRSEVEEKWLKIQLDGTFMTGPITSRKRTALVDRPPIWPGADVIMRERKIELGEERQEKKRRVMALRDDDTGKGKEIAMDAHGAQAGSSMPPGPTFSVERITRSSRLRATRVTGRSVGVAAFEEMIAFEKRGVELGELPDYFSFQK